MLLLVGIELARFATDIRSKHDLAPLAATVIVSVVTNMALGFVLGLGIHYLTQYVARRRGHSRAEIGTTQ